MGFKRDFTDQDVAAFLERKKQAFINALIDRMSQIGEQFIADARSELSRWKYIEVTAAKKGSSLNTGVFYRNGKKYTRTSGGGNSFTDITANLRNSIGYGIYRDRQFIAGNFGTGKGGKAAKDKAQEVAMLDGLCIVFVAGMDYAIYVESKGYDVITGAAKDAMKALKIELKKLLQKTRKR
ncbi:hypothetical protein ABDK00_013225 [Niabella insulamsoli]|uniref:hypothetical protein n=1 Tax=Niabella insulamsoli TaxID=3144874 RepID=UPI0031FBEFD7